jgi:hypothetical protein
MSRDRLLGVSRCAAGLPSRAPHPRPKSDDAREARNEAATHAPIKHPPAQRVCLNLQSLGLTTEFSGPQARSIPAWANGPGNQHDDRPVSRGLKARLMLLAPRAWLGPSALGHGRFEVARHLGLIAPGWYESRRWRSINCLFRRAKCLSLY